MKKEAIRYKGTVGTKAKDAHGRYWDEGQVRPVGKELDEIDPAIAQRYVNTGCYEWCDREKKAATPEPGAAPVTTTSFPLIITHEQRAELRERGYTDKAIDAMTPIEALDILAKPTKK